MRFWISRNTFYPFSMKNTPFFDLNQSAVCAHNRKIDHFSHFRPLICQRIIIFVESGVKSHQKHGKNVLFLLLDAVCFVRHESQNTLFFTVSRILWGLTFQGIIRRVKNMQNNHRWKIAFLVHWLHREREAKNRENSKIVFNHNRWDFAKKSVSLRWFCKILFFGYEKNTFDDTRIGHRHAIRHDQL